MTIWVVFKEEQRGGCSMVSAHLTRETANLACEGHDDYDFQEVELLTNKKITVE